MAGCQAVGGLKGNWVALWVAAGRDHCHAGLVWNESTRRELRDALEREEAGLRAARTRVAKVWNPKVSWSHWGLCMLVLMAGCMHKAVRILSMLLAPICCICCSNSVLVCNGSAALNRGRSCWQHQTPQSCATCCATCTSMRPKHHLEPPAAVAARADSSR
jgi:hypothetical protein